MLIHDVLRKYKDAQFLMCTHWPITLGYLDAQILSFPEGRQNFGFAIDTEPLSNSCYSDFGEQHHEVLAMSARDERLVQSSQEPLGAQAFRRAQTRQHAQARSC